MSGCLSAGYKANAHDGSDGIVKLDSVDSMDEVSSDGEAGGVSGAEWMDEGVVGRVDIEAVNLKMGVDVAGGVGGFSGCNGDGGNGGMERTVAICRTGNRGGGIFSFFRTRSGGGEEVVDSKQDSLQRFRDEVGPMQRDNRRQSKAVG
jgi:hypothetical protein